MGISTWHRAARTRFLLLSVPTYTIKVNFKGATPATLVEETADGKAYNAFSDLDFTKGIKIYVPAASADAYRKAAVWSKYSEYIVGK